MRLLIAVMILQSIIVVLVRTLTEMITISVAYFSETINRSDDAQTEHRTKFLQGHLSG